MKLFQTSFQCITKKVFVLFLLMNTTNAYSCDNAQMIDYDYQIKETLGNGYSTFGRLWVLDNKKSCVNSLRYAACITITPEGDFADLTIEISKNKNTSSTYTQKVKYNSSEVIRFNTLSMDVYLKLFVSNVIADSKMSGKSCNNGFPALPRQVTRKELDNMYKG